MSDEPPPKPKRLMQAAQADRRYAQGLVSVEVKIRRTPEAAPPKPDASPPEVEKGA